MMSEDFERKNLENWKWGVFYFNRKDFRIIVPKQNPIMGWTFNFAHPVGYIFIILILATVVFQSINK